MWDESSASLLSFLRDVGWRHAKGDIEDEISIPPPVYYSVPVLLSVLSFPSSPLSHQLVLLVLIHSDWNECV